MGHSTGRLTGLRGRVSLAAEAAHDRASKMDRRLEERRSALNQARQQTRRFSVAMTTEIEKQEEAERKAEAKRKAKLDAERKAKVERKRKEEAADAAEPGSAGSLGVMAGL